MVARFIITDRLKGALRDIPGDNCEVVKAKKGESLIQRLENDYRGKTAVLKAL